MICKKLGKTGELIPEVGMGTCDYRGGPEPLRAGLDAGARFIDTAESYGTEPVVAEAMGGVRERIFLATKVSVHHFRRAELLQAADQSLRRLRTDYLDLYQLHKPNEAVPLEETLGAMEDLVDAGKVRFIGVSNFSVAQLERAQRAMRRHRIVSNQVRYSIIDRTIESGLLSFCQRHDVTVIAYSPLGRVFQRILDCDPQGALRKLGRELGRTPAQVALNWCLSREAVVAIPRGNSPAHILDNCGASGWRLTPGQIRELDQAVRFRRRSSFEMLLRRCFPHSLKSVFLGLLQFCPRSVRRRIT